MMIILRLIGVLINMFDRAFYHTNDKKDWDDFWYNSDPIYPPETNTNYNQLVDHLVSTMTIHSTKDSKEWTDNLEAPFNTEAYRNYMKQTNIERAPFIPKKVTPTERKSFDELYEEFKSKSVEDQIENLKELGRELVTRIDRIVDRLDVILEEDKKD